MYKADAARRFAQGWADVYYFCGSKFQFCTCDFRWNRYGYAHAAILAAFVLSTATALQNVVIAYAFGGLLPGKPRGPPLPKQHSEMALLLTTRSMPQLKEERDPSMDFIIYCRPELIFN